MADVAPADLKWMDDTAADLGQRLAQCGPVPVAISYAGSAPGKYLRLRRELLRDLETKADAVAAEITAAQGAAPGKPSEKNRRGKLTFPLLPDKKPRAPYVEITPSVVRSTKGGAGLLADSIRVAAEKVAVAGALGGALPQAVCALQLVVCSLQAGPRPDYCSTHCAVPQPLRRRRPCGSLGACGAAAAAGGGPRQQRVVCCAV
jgi:hypothetical protein